jgi:hypothetical protein
VILSSSGGELGSVQIDPDSTPDPTPFFSDFKDAKNYFFHIFFSYNLPTGTLSSVLEIYIC